MPYKELLRKIDSYAKVIREHRPLTPDEVKELDSYFRIGMTYSSNALEGNSLTLSETKVLLEDGITVGGKPIRDCYEATGHAQAYDYMLQTARGGPLQFREEDILRLHALFYSGIDRTGPDATAPGRCLSPARSIFRLPRRRCRGR